MSGASYPVVNGTIYDFSSIEFTIGTFGKFRVQEISYKNMVEMSDVFGNAAQKLGRTRGQLNAEASMTLLKADFQNFVNAAGDGYMEEVFDITVTYANRNQPLQTDKIIGARFVEHEDSHSNGSDPLVVPIPLNAMWCEINGKKPFRDMLA